MNTAQEVLSTMTTNQAMKKFIRKDGRGQNGATVFNEPETWITWLDFEDDSTISIIDNKMSLI